MAGKANLNTSNETLLAAFSMMLPLTNPHHSRAQSTTDNTRSFLPLINLSPRGDSQMEQFSLTSPN